MVTSEAPVADMPVEGTTLDITTTNPARMRVRRVIDDELFLLVFQPIVDVRSGTTPGMEALSRFPAEPARPPNAWFAEAAGLGLGTALELATVEHALAQLPDLPADAFLAVNVTARTAQSRLFLATLDQHPVDRIVVELQYDDGGLGAGAGDVVDHEKLARILRPLRDRGLRVAVEELGGGVLQLGRLVALEPDIIKISADTTLVVDREPEAQALTESLVSLARGTPMRVAAQHVEHQAQLDALTLLGVDWCQGYLVGRPGHLRARREPRV